MSVLLPIGRLPCFPIQFCLWEVISFRRDTSHYNVAWRARVSPARYAILGRIAHDTLVITRTGGTSGAGTTLVRRVQAWMP